MKRWNYDENKLLLKLYTENNMDISSISEYLNRTYISVDKKLRKLGIIKREKEHWSEVDDLKIRQSYPTSNKQELMELLPKRKWCSIKSRAVLLGIKKYNAHCMKRLLENSNEAYYWIGFILADGCVIPKFNGIGIELSNKDQIHLDNLQKFLGTNIKYYKRTRGSKHQMCNLRIHDRYITKMICAKYNLQIDKTHNPPNLLNIFNNSTSDNIMSLIIGYIDGDGCIYKGSHNTRITLEVHHSWYDILCLMEDFVYTVLQEHKKRRYTYYKTRDKRKSAILVFSKKALLSKIKNEIIKLKIPVLSRKWDIIQ